MKDPMSLRLGTLREPLLARCDRTGETPSEVCRLGIAKELGVATPEMSAGSAANAETAARANTARWKHKQKRRKKSSG